MTVRIELQQVSKHIDPQLFLQQVGPLRPYPFQVLNRLAQYGRCERNRRILSAKIQE
jgi:hypothetical protein